MTDRHTSESPNIDFWRSLRYFNLYRLALATLFVLLAAVFGNSLLLGAHSLKLFFVAGIIYVIVAILFFVPLRLHWPHFTLQLAGQVGCDIVGLTVLSHASGGIQSGIGLLLLISLAAAGLISRGKITLFFSSLASIAALLEHSYSVLYNDAIVAHYVQVGLLCVSYFAVAWLAHTLAKYAVISQQLAQRRGHDLASLSEASRLVMRDMHDGVLVVDEHGVIMQMNPSAARLLRHSAMPGSKLSENFPLLFGEYALWKRTGTVNKETLQLDEGVQARLNFVAVKRNAAHGVVIFLEDMQRIMAQAQQIKLAALGRLTANIAHEVRNPLSSISYAAELLRESINEDHLSTSRRAKEEQEGVNRLLQIVLDNTGRINRIVQDVMQMNRRDRAQPEAFELNNLLLNFVEEFTLAERLNPEVINLTESLDFEVSFDRGHLHQVLWNLCSNAIRYCQKLPGSLTLTTNIVNGRPILEVLDDGPGIPCEHLSKLFEPFFTTATDGTGLGLYIAKELCEANGALLEYLGQEKDDGRSGACFRITFKEPHENTNEYGERK